MADKRKPYEPPMAEVLPRQEELARNLHDVASNQQVTDSLRSKGFSDSSESLATKKQVKSDWISVKDRLPEELRRVLVFVPEKRGLMGKPDIDTDRVAKGRWVRWGEYVTHWMPLPEPPKEEA